MDTNWQIAYYVSQFVLVSIAASAAIFAWMQLDSSKIFELMRFINEKRFRDARTSVIKNIEPIRDLNWWDDDRYKHLELDASEVCVGYNIVGVLFDADAFGIMGGMKRRWRIVLTHLAPSIVRCHLALSSFIDHRRSVVPTAYSGFSKLAAGSKGYAPIAGPRTPN